jgi:hypothetical protein
VNFQPDLAQAVMAGRKTVTRRLVSDNPRSPWWRERCGLRPERDYAVCPGRGKHALGRVRIIGVERETLGHIGEHEAIREGFADEAEFESRFSGLHGGYPPSSRWQR